MAPFPSATTEWHSNTYPSVSPTRPELSAKGKIVVVTGGGTGIGAETAKYFAEAGASKVIILGRREQPLLDTKALIEEEFPETKVLTASTDVTKKDQVDAAFAKLIGENNDKINVLVSNAAVTGPFEAVKDVDIEKYLQAIQVNLGGSLNVAQAFLKYAASDAVVIDVNSSAAHVNYSDMFSSYSVAKLTVYRMWDTLAFGHPDMSVFHIQPGVVDTAMNREVGGVAAIGYEDHVSLPASFMVWLASPEAQFLKNKFLWSNWDVDELKARAEEIRTGRLLNIDLVGWPFQLQDHKFEWKSQENASA